MLGDDQLTTPTGHGSALTCDGGPPCAAARVTESAKSYQPILPLKRLQRKVPLKGRVVLPVINAWGQKPRESAR